MPTVSSVLNAQRRRDGDLTVAGPFILPGRGGFRTASITTALAHRGHAASIVTFPTVSGILIREGLLSYLPAPLAGNSHLTNQAWPGCRRCTTQPSCRDPPKAQHVRVQKEIRHEEAGDTGDDFEGGDPLIESDAGDA
jgi:hypothetical protein